MQMMNASRGFEEQAEDLRSMQMMNASRGFEEHADDERKQMLESMHIIVDCGDYSKRGSEEEWDAGSLTEWCALEES
jgi:hypothetical protein